MRVAVCISGQPRTWRTSYKNLMNFFDLDSVQVDYFIHTWDTNSYRPLFQPPETKTDYKLNPKEEDEIKECFKPKYMIYEEYKKENFQRWEPLLYSFNKSVFLKRKYEIENDFRYDLVIKMRFDINFKQEGLNNKGLRLDKFYLHNVQPLNAYNPNELFEYKFNIEFNATNFDDVFFYSDSKTMDIISNVYFWYKKILERSHLSMAKGNYIEDSEFFYGPGTLLYTYLVSKNIHPICEVCTPYYVVRKEAEDLGLDSVNDWERISIISHGFYWELIEKGII